MRYFPLIASAAFLAADSFPFLPTYHNSSPQMFSSNRFSLLHFSQRNLSQTTIAFNNQNHLFAQLNFNSEQKQKVEQICNNYQIKISQQQQKLQIAQQELVELFKKDNLLLIDAKHQEILQLRQTLEQLNFESLLAIRDVLTPLQRRKFAYIIESRQIKSQQNQLIRF